MAKKVAKKAAPSKATKTQKKPVTKRTARSTTTATKKTTTKPSAVQTKSKATPAPAKPRGMTPNERVFAYIFGKVYPLYVQKAEKKNRTKEEVDQVICWLTGYDRSGLRRQIEQQTSFEEFFAQAPAIHPNSSKITGVICGVRLENIDNPLMRNIRYMDKLVDELANGRPMEKILRQ